LGANHIAPALLVQESNYSREGNLFIVPIHYMTCDVNDE